MIIDYWLAHFACPVFRVNAKNFLSLRWMRRSLFNDVRQQLTVFSSSFYLHACTNLVYLPIHRHFNGASKQCKQQCKQIAYTRNLSMLLPLLYLFLLEFSLYITLLFPVILSANRLCFIGKCLVFILFTPIVCSVYPLCLLLTHNRDLSYSRMWRRWITFVKKLTHKRG